MSRMQQALAGLAIAGLIGFAGAPASADDAAKSTWPQFGRTVTHLNNAPNETAFTPDTIRGLGIAWRAHLGDHSTDTGGAVVARGSVYIGGTDGVLSVFNSDGCGEDVCEPVWTAVTDNGIHGTPAVAGSVVLVGSADHFLYAFPAKGCGEPKCEPLWRGQMVSAALASSPAVADGVAYIGDYSGRLYAFPVAGCGKAICDPTWVGRGRPTEQIVSTPAVADGHVYVGTFLSTPDLVSGRLLVFSTDGCGTDAICRPEWTAGLHGPMAGNAAPLVSGGIVYAGSTTRFGEHPDSQKHLFAFHADGCGAAVCKPAWFYKTDDQGVIGGPALDGEFLYASVQATPDPNTVGVAAIYPAFGCDRRTCKPFWTYVNFASGFESPPVIAGGLVLVAKGPASGFPVDAAVLSYATGGCGHATCTPISFTPSGDEQEFLGAPLAVADATIFMASQESSGPTYLYAFKVSR